MLPDLRNLLEFTHKFQCSSELCQFVLNRVKENLCHVSPVDLIRFGKNYCVPELVDIGVDRL